MNKKKFGFVSNELDSGLEPVKAVFLRPKQYCILDESDYLKIKSKGIKEEIYKKFTYE